MSVKFTRSDDEALDGIIDEAEQVITKLSLRLERKVKTSMRGGGLPHAPSLPGEPPRVDTGRLRASITHEVQVFPFEPAVVGRVGSNVRYLRFLELGTAKMLPRPSLRPALRALRGVQRG